MRSEKVAMLSNRMNQADSAIELNKNNMVINAEKDRKKVKKLNQQMDNMQKDFEQNIHADPEKMTKTISYEIQHALLRMTEKKMKAEAALKEAQAAMEEKDKRILELERTVSMYEQRLGLNPKGVIPFIQNSRMNSGSLRNQASHDDLNDRQPFSSLE